MSLNVGCIACSMGDGRGEIKPFMIPLCHNINIFKEIKREKNGKSDRIIQQSKYVEEACRKRK